MITLNQKPRGLAQSPPLSLYIHLPWCIRKCPYCDFNSHEPKGSLLSITQGLDLALQARYIQALIADLSAALPLVWGRPVHSVFIGGGTPSLFDAASIDDLLNQVRSLLPLAPQAEITMEANPGTFEAKRFTDFAKAGVNRLSIGVQSFNAAHLKALGRVHDPDQAKAAAALAAQVFPSFNLDLMYGLPDQSLEQLQADLTTALAFAPPHLSYYQLTLEPNTLFAAKPPPLPDDDITADMQQAIEQATAQAGLEHYEVSAYARSGKRSQHNLNYWCFGDYLGIGAGAHSKLSFFDRIVRQTRWRHPATYMQAALGEPVTEKNLGQRINSPSGLMLQNARVDPATLSLSAPNAAIELDEQVSPHDLPFEFMLNVLRLIEGVPNELFEQRTGLWPTALQKGIRQALAKGLLADNPARYQASDLGLRFLNDLQQCFLETSA
jgi:putative oxygen-independent coproporphyrinogen III oxidase